MSTLPDRLNAADVVLAKAREPDFRDRTALHHAGGAVTFGALDAWASRAASYLASCGFARGDRVCLLMKDTPLFCAAYLGIMRAGLVAIAMNTRLTPAEQSFVVADSGARLVVADDEFLAVVATAAAASGARVMRARGAGDAFEAAVAASDARFTSVAAQADEPAFWLYSSGTTGNPKAILHSHANAATAGKLMREVARAGPGTVVLGTSRLFFAFGLDNAFLGPLSCGAATIVNEEWPTPESVVDQVERYRPDVFLAVPTFYRRLLQLPPERLAAMKGIRINVTGGERFPEALAAQWTAAVGTEVLVAHGMSETFCNTFCNRPGRSRLGTCGTALAGVETRLTDAEGRSVAPGEPGQLWVKHPSLALRYKSDAATARTFRDGWFFTGDLFSVDAEGYYTHEGRADELLKVAGQWVKPTEVEEAVLADARVKEAACVVVPDADGFDRLALFVVAPGLAEDDALQLAATRLGGLPTHCRPKWVRVAAELPRTATGKVQHRLLRQRLVEG